MAHETLPDPSTQERIARNEATFREANERIGDVADELGIDSPIPFLCECADPACRELVQLTAAEYAEVRESPRWFLNVPGHEAAARGAARVVHERDRYAIVEKIALAGEVAEQQAEEANG